MNDITFFFSLSLGSYIAIYLFWFICHFNGKIIFYFVRVASQHFARVKDTSLKYFDYRGIPMTTICLTGAMPLAILSVSTAAFNSCFNSVYATGILEAILGFTFIFMPTKVKKQFDLFGINLLRKNLSLLFYSGLWCLIFAFWAVTNHHQSLDYMISNTNPDMWAYVRRFAAMITDNLNFYGLTDSFTFNGNSACAFLLGSPKKFSSFLGSLIIYPFHGSSLGIAVFQGMLGGSLFICLFKEWFVVRLSNRDRAWFGKLVMITWALFAPPIFWLLVSAYFSNALFLIIICLTLRQAREVAIASRVDTLENLVCFVAILTVVFAFYPAFLPVIISTYLVVTSIYLPRETLSTKTSTKIIFRFAGVIIGCGLIFYILFPSQLGLYEIQKSLNILNRHGSNFVPLNPWSLLQEKPKPMALTRDFGWYINIIIGLLFSVFLGRTILRKYRKSSKNLVRQDLLAALMGVGLYGGYLLAYIPLEHTYRLMKIAISLIYPVAIFGLLPFILWSKNQLMKKSAWMRNGVLVLAIAHTVFHVYKVFDLHTFPSGSFTLSNTSRLENIQSIVIVGCEDVHSSQFYERLVGLQVARRYPDIQVRVVNSPKNLDDVPTADLSIYGETIPGATAKRNTCHFSI